MLGSHTHAEAEHDAADDELGQLVGGAGEDGADQEADAAQQHGAAASVPPEARPGTQALRWSEGTGRTQAQQWEVTTHAAWLFHTESASSMLEVTSG